MKTLISRLVSKFIIRQIKKGAVKNETTIRLLIHFTALKMQDMGKDEINITYNHDDLKSTFFINAKLK